MASPDKEAFDKYWSNFIAQVKGKLIKVASNQTVTNSYANLILNDVASSWFSEYDVNGKWLLEYKKKNPEKAKQVYEVLGNMHFQELESSGEISPAYDFVIPTIGALGGWCISYFCGAVPIIRIISTLAPAGVLYPIARTWRLKMGALNKDKAMEAYVGQLDRYHNSIDSILD